MSKKAQKYPKTRSSKVYCQEKFSCDGERVEAVYECEDCGSKQCSVCSVKLHELSKFVFHDLKKVTPVPSDRLCQATCKEANYADVRCLDCKLNLCYECFARMHLNGKKSQHKKTPFSMFMDTSKERMIPSLGNSEGKSSSSLNPKSDTELEFDFQVPGEMSALKPMSPFSLPDDSLTYFTMPQNQGTDIDEMTSLSRNMTRPKAPVTAQPTNIEKTVSKSKSSKSKKDDKSQMKASTSAATIGTTEVNVAVAKKSMKTSMLEEVLDEINDDSETSNLMNGNESSSGSFMLADERENLRVNDEDDFVKRLGCDKNVVVKVISIFGNTGDGKSHTLNHTFFGGKEIFATSCNPDSCTVGVWASFDPRLSAIIIDTEGLLGVSVNQNQRTRLLLKVMAISDVVIYRTRADRLHNDLYQFLGDASKAFQKHFSDELKAASERCNLDLPLSTLCPAVLIFHETQHTDVLGNATETAELFLRKRFREMDLSVEFSALQYIGTRTRTPPTNFKCLRKAVKEQFSNNTVRSPRKPQVVLQMLKVLNEKFSGDIEKSVPSTFPDQYFTCSHICLSCNSRCTMTMNHTKEGMAHFTETRCRFQHQYDNMVYTCKGCLERRGQEEVLIPKTCASSDNQWFGLAKYAWSGYVLECPHCGVIFRSRQFWYGNEDPIKSVARTEIKHVWPDGNPVLQGTHNAARRLIDGFHYLSDTVASVSAKPVKLVGNWVTDQIAPPYWVPNSQITKCYQCRTNLDHNEQIHHCRGCGQGFCDDCTQHKKPVPERGWGDDPVRVCDKCYETTTSMTDSNESDDAGLRARMVGEVISNALGTVASAIDYPLDVIKDSSRPTYWIPDHEIKVCCVCELEFGPKLRIHHCRSCGRGVCDLCSPDRKAVKSRGWDHPVRVCKNCVQIQGDL